MTSKTLTAIQVDIETVFSPDRSFIDEHSYVFSYTVHIKNTSEETVQLVSRHWFFENAYGKKYEVEGLVWLGSSHISVLAKYFLIRAQLKSTPQMVLCMEAIVWSSQITVHLMQLYKNLC